VTNGLGRSALERGSVVKNAGSAGAPGTTDAAVGPWSEQLRAVAGLAAVVAGVLAVVVIALVALSKGTQTAGTIAASSAGVIATIVGAYFGVKVGTDQTKDAVEGERRQAAKATVMAAHLDPEKANDVLATAEAAARGESEPMPQAGQEGEG
jgi:hypothetical protein